MFAQEILNHVQAPFSSSGIGEWKQFVGFYLGHIEDINVCFRHPYGEGKGKGEIVVLGLPIHMPSHGQYRCRAQHTSMKDISSQVFKFGFRNTQLAATVNSSVELSLFSVEYLEIRIIKESDPCSVFC